MAGILIPAGTPTPEGFVYTEDRVPVEAQAWWANDEKPLPGSHIHVGTYFPWMQKIKGVVPFDLHLQLHDDPGPTSGFRVQIFDIATVSFPIKVRGNPDYDAWHQIHVDTTQAPYDGEREFRMTFNVPKTLGHTANPGARMYNTTRWHAILNNGKPLKNGGEGANRRIGAGGWYTGVDYQNAYIHEDDFRPILTAPVSGVWKPRVRIQDCKTAEVVLDARSHFADPGISVYKGPALSSFTPVPIDTTKLANGRHQLFIMGIDQGTSPKGEARAVLKIPFEVAN